MMNQHRTNAQPGPACAAVAPLLEQVIGEGPLDAEQARALRAHLATCASCRAELDSFRQLDAALARHFQPPSRNPLSSADIRAIIQQTARPRDQPFTLPTRDAAPGQQRPLPTPAAPARPRSPAFISALGALAAVVLIAAVGAALVLSHRPTQPGAHLSATATATPTASTVAGPVYTPQGKDILTSISMVSASDGWAVGSRFEGPGIRSLLFLHYNGQQWEEISGPSNQSLQATSAQPSQVVMVSATEGWAVGNLIGSDGQTNHGFVLHFAQGRWAMQVNLPNVELSSLAMASASEGWVVGAIVSPDGTPQQGIYLHYVTDAGGSAWQQVNGMGSELDQVAMTGHDDGWMVGKSQSGASALWHYNGSAWTPATMPAMQQIDQIAPISATDVWAVGINTSLAQGAGNADARASGGNVDPIFAHYNGTAWSSVQTPVSGNALDQINSLVMDAASDGWAFGIQIVPNGSGVAGSVSIYLHYTNGQWQRVNGPDVNETLQASMLSSSDGWAVGDGAAILHYQQGTWTVVINH